MTKTMLIDASHTEETRVVIVDQNRVEDFDFESAARRPIRGNIYLAKVTRVEPSLQAAFVDYGGNRHGFLPLSEIHPDYYQIPISDREKLLAEQAKAAAVEPDMAELDAEETSDDEATADAKADDDDGKARDDAGTKEADEDDAEKALRDNRRRLIGKYNIQEVIKRRQILLIQVVKEERGNKGAALTTYLSLAGRYCVLMPNTARGGGISRKITNVADRKRLKQSAASLAVPGGMGVIIRTAGAKRTKTEIKRDYDHLLRLWENIRKLTLESMAPSLIYEEGNLVKRAIRDLYDKTIESVLVEGDAAYREAKDFMKMLMPSHAKHVQPYKDDVPLFQRRQVETQLESMATPRVELKSGGYLIINPTEALVSVDVNSGKSTKERNVEQTALKTNLEAAEEMARQCRLRDLAGLIVIDFIDMEDNRNNRAVEKRLKDAMSVDRARIQIGKISSFGLLEMSRQRRRSSVLEGTTVECPHCKGTGYIRAPGSAALAALRALEDEAMKSRGGIVTLRVAPDVAGYVLNKKRAEVVTIEERTGATLFVDADPTLANHEMSATHVKGDRDDTPIRTREVAVTQTQSYAGEDEPQTADVAVDEEADDDAPRRRRRRRRRKEDAVLDAEAQDAVSSEQDDAESDDTEDRAAADGQDDDDQPKRRRRRGRRGGRGRRRGGAEETRASGEETALDGDGDAPVALQPGEPSATDADPSPVDAVEDKPEPAEDAPPAKPVRRRRTRAKAADADTADATAKAKGDPATPDAADDGTPQTAKADEPTDTESEAEAKPKRRRASRKKAPDAAVADRTAEDAPAIAASSDEAAEPAPEKPKRRRAPRKKVADAAPVAENGAGASETDQDAPPVAEPAATAPPATEAPVASKAASEQLGGHDLAEGDAPEDAEAEAKPARKRGGWWQRALRGL